MNAQVIKTIGDKYLVKNKLGKTYSCRLKGNFKIKNIRSTNPIVVGDHVELSFDLKEIMIVKLLPRKNKIVRKSVNLSKRTHVLAANIDQALLIITLDEPVTTRSFIDRFLVSAYANNVNVILIFNKQDLLSQNLLEKQNYLMNLYQKIGYEVFCISCLNDDLSKLKNVMKNKLNMISGHSGVGKSTLINRIQPTLNINTNPISTSNNQGQHTTTHSEIFDLDCGGSVIDTPGIRGFGLIDISVEQIKNAFFEFLNYSKNCKFYNCLHKDEPSCEVKKAVSDGKIDLDRYNNYLKLIDVQEDKYRS